MSNWPAPCALCGYNGPGFFQPTTHPCAKARRSVKAALKRLGGFRRMNHGWED